MKIAFILSTCAKSGPFIVASDIINNISVQNDPIDVYYIKESSLKLSFKAYLFKKSFFKKIDLSKYDIIHSHGFLGDFYTFLNRKSIQGKWITTLHQEIKTDYSMSYNKLIGTLLEIVWLYIVSKTSSIVCLTSQMADYYKAKKSCKKDKITFVYNGVTPTPQANLELLSDEVILIEKTKKSFKIMGISANVIYRKGIDRVIQALALPNAHNLALIILGDGPEKPKLIQMAKDLNISERVLFLGFKSNAIDYFRYFDIYMMSSRSEGFGLCVLEAASQKIPVVCNDLPVYRELFSKEEVVRFNLDDLVSIASAANTAITNRNVLSELIYKKYTQAYSAEIMAENYLGIYNQLKKSKTQ